ncbi:hypothetical protein BZ13_135 [Francisella philomiragia subsp. philomiragia ATCC 25015]|uniref:DUF2237 family protein n=1 Tax=Francisella philomiragia TaxID=28110 RepID=UPI0001AF7AD4|nr:DUF2237 domain-containing protein [Francisella philomiragia]AJI75257.1 hypothetical protein BZ13_135 [Francisella philomiragia subsp. philomiragia ATCC 25015]EET21603.1 conserved hypothetical protein [Francisella philomiragia subsp. philomiragia ATCC 25015]MBK2238033.1 DUF2237 domain-containing protein [Francisella philomiragia]
MSEQKNVLGGMLKLCCLEPKTGFYRDGFCRTDNHDHGLHVVCAIMTKEFLEYTASRGNDLSTPNLLFDFPGLKAGDKWCLCALRWLEAYQNGVAPEVVLESTNEKTLQVVKKEYLLEKAHSVEV